MRRQVALDLAEPVIADRFRLLAHATFALAALMGFRLVYPWLAGQRLSEAPALLLVIGVVAIYAVVNLYCALLSPAVYRRWLASKLAKAGS